VNARLLFISVDVWCRHSPKNAAVLTVDINIALLVTPADKIGLITIN